MSHTISIQQASAKLGELVRSLGPNDEIVLTDNDKPVARIVPSVEPKERQPGAWKGKLEILDDRDDDILDDFRQCLP
jgi:antitoxin (DNA-binding transcriptional repressor) of toxin-antitoxin stability system